MNPGRLDTLVSIRRAATTRAPNGSVISTWSDVAEVWAAIEPASGREAMIAQQLSTQVSAKATIRHGSGVTVKDRIVDGSTVYEVTRVANTGTRNSWQEIWLTEAKPS